MPRTSKRKRAAVPVKKARVEVPLKKARMMMVPTSPLEVEDTLFHIFSYLDAKDLKNARLVSRRWNQVALPICKRKMTMSLTSVVAGQVVAEGHPQLFHSTRLQSSKRSGENWARFLEAPRMYQAPDSGSFQICSFVRRLEVIGGVEMKQVIPAINKGSLKHLEGLTLTEVWDRKVAYRTMILPGSLAKLQTLALLTKGRKEATKEFFINHHLRMYESLILAAPSISSVQTEVHLDLESLTKLTRLSVRQYGSDVDITKMISGVRSRLRYLSLHLSVYKTWINLIPPPSPWPVMEGVEQVDFHGRFPFKTIGWRMSDSLPNLKTFRYRGDGRTISNWDWMESRPQSLKVLEVTCCNSESGFGSNISHHSFLEACKKALKFPNLETLIVRSSCVLQEEPVSTLLQSLVNMEVKRLVLELEERFEFPDLLMSLSKVHFNKGRKKGGVIEFRNGNGPRTTPDRWVKGDWGDLDCVKHLLNTWSSAVFKYFELPEEMDYIKMSVESEKEANYRMKMFCRPIKKGFRLDLVA